MKQQFKTILKWLLDTILAVIVLFLIIVVLLWFSAWDNRTSEITNSGDFVAAQLLRQDGYNRVFISPDSLAARLAFKRETLQNLNRSTDDITSLIREFIPRLNKDGIMDLKPDERNKVAEILARYSDVAISPPLSLTDIFGWEEAEKVRKQYISAGEYRVSPWRFLDAIWADLRLFTFFVSVLTIRITIIVLPRLRTREKPDTGNTDTSKGNGADEREGGMSTGIKSGHTILRECEEKIKSRSLKNL